MNNTTDVEDARPSLSSQLFQQEQEFIAPGIQELAQLPQMAIKSAQGRYLEDLDGNRYLDFMAGVCVCSLGHSHPEYIRAIKAQLDQVTIGSFTSANRVKLLRTIASLTPLGLDKIQLYSGGAEAVEAALRLAKAHTQKFEVLSFWGGFHGKSGGVLGLIGDPFKKNWGVLHPGSHIVPYATCYRCPFKSDYPQCGLLCLDFVRQYIENSTAGSLAAILVETMQGTAGNLIPPPEFLPGLLEIARENDALLIADEMITGFGRTGKTFGCNHTNIVPDIMTIGKGMGNGFPISGLVSTQEITSALPFAKPSSSSSSYGGNPLACAASYATVKTIITEKLVENSQNVGAYLLEGLNRLQEKYAFIGSVSGLGLMIGVELVKDRQTKEPLDKAACQAIYLESLKRGLLGMNYKANFRINPPLSITREEVDEGLDILDQVFAGVRL